MGGCSVGEYGLVDDVHDLSEGGRRDVALAAVDLSDQDGRRFANDLLAG